MPSGGAGKATFSGARFRKLLDTASKPIEFADRMAMGAVLNKATEFRQYEKPIEVQTILRMRGLTGRALGP